MRISDWSSDVCSSDHLCPAARLDAPTASTPLSSASTTVSSGLWNNGPETMSNPMSPNAEAMTLAPRSWPSCPILAISSRSEENTSELQSLMRRSYAVFCLKKHIYAHLSSLQHRDFIKRRL